jgi:hypothetical protein
MFTNSAYFQANFFGDKTKSTTQAIASVAYRKICSRLEQS